MPLRPGPQPGAQRAVGEWEVPEERTLMGMEGFSRWGFFAADHESQLDCKAAPPPPIPPTAVLQVISVLQGLQASSHCLIPAAVS